MLVGKSIPQVADVAVVVLRENAIPQFFFVPILRAMFLYFEWRLKNSFSLSSVMISINEGDTWK